MGVYIRGMKMPARCCECELEASGPVIHECMLLYINDHTNVVRENGRLEDCPLVEVKMPHGDLIDRDELQPDIFRDWEDCGYNAEDAYSESYIANAPAVIEAEGGE